MSAHPRVLPTSPDGSVWDAISDLRREVRQVRESRANQPQHAYAENLVTQGPLSAETTLCQVTINIPTKDHRVLLVASAFWQQSNATSEWVLGYRNDVDLPTRSALAWHTNYGLAENIGTQVYPQSSGFETIAAQSPFHNPYWYAAEARVPTPGDHTWSLLAWRNNGTATLSVVTSRLWVGVL